MGTVNEDGSIDYNTLLKNGDRDKILGTIGAMAYFFSKNHPKKWIFLTGNNKIKTRLYQMAINNAFEQLNQTFIIQGLYGQDYRFRATSFKKGINYDAFLFKRRSER